MTRSHGPLLGRMILVLGMIGSLFSPAPTSIRASTRPPRTRNSAHGSPSPHSPAAAAAALSHTTVRARIEPRIRHLVADQLAVSPDELVPAVSLTDELAADSLDMLELVLALESAFAIVVPEPAIAEMRSYKDVVDVVMGCVLDAGRDGLASRWDLQLRSRVTSGRDGAPGEFVRVDGCTPYAIQSIEDDALRAGRGARLEVAVSANAPDIENRAVTYVRDQLAWLEERGIAVAVYRA